MQLEEEGKRVVEQEVFFSGGARGAQPAKPLTLGFRSGHDLTVRGFEPRIGLYNDGAEPA